MIAQAHSVERDQFGDPTETPRGEIQVIPGRLGVELVMDGLTSTDGQMGIKRGGTSTGYTMEEGDKLTMPNGYRFALQGPAMGDYASFTGWQPDYLWWKVAQSN